MSGNPLQIRQDLLKSLQLYEAISKFISRTDVDYNGSPLMFYVHVYIGVEPFFMFPVMLTRHVY